MVLHFGYSSKIVGIKTAFLYGDLEEEIYMECPKGMSDVKKDDCIILNKCIYGLVQAVCQYHKKVIKILKSFGFIGGNIDPCLYVKKSAKGIVYVAFYLDDNLMIGNSATIDEAILALKNKGLVLKIMEGLQDYLSCKIKISNDRKHAWLGQPHLIKNLKSKFEKLVNEVQSHKTPNTPKFLIIRPVEDIEKILTDDQLTYRSGIGMLLYLVKHVHHDIANTTRELSKVNDGVNPAAYTELLQVIKYVIDMEMLGLKINPWGILTNPGK